MLQHWVAHWLGMDGNPDIAAAWGGFISCIGMFVAVGAFLRHHNCHAKWCPFLGRHKVEGTDFMVCRVHHPQGHRTAQDIHAAWRKANPHHAWQATKTERQSRGD